MYNNNKKLQQWAIKHKPIKIWPIFNWITLNKPLHTQKQIKSKKKIFFGTQREREREREKTCEGFVGEDQRSSCGTKDQIQPSPLLSPSSSKFY